FGSGVTSKSDTASLETQSEADAAASKVGGETDATMSAEQSKGETAETSAQTQGTNAGASAESAKSTAEVQGGQIENALPVAEHRTDRVKAATQPAPAAKMPGADTPVPKAAAETWNCDEASVLNKVSSAGKAVIDRMTKVVKAIVPESVLNFAQQGI